MHEAAAMKGVVSQVLECMREAGADRVAGVQLTLGASGHFTQEAARQYFELLTAGTSAEGAVLSIVWLPATFQCFSCLHRFQSCEPVESVLCPLCGEMALEVEHQDICAVSSVDVFFADEDVTVSK